MRQQLADETAAKTSLENLNKKLTSTLEDLQVELQDEIKKKEESEKAKRALGTELENLKVRISTWRHYQVEFILKLIF